MRMVRKNMEVKNVSNNCYSNGAVQKKNGKPSRQHMIVTTNSSIQRRVSHTAQKFWRSSEFLGFSPGRGVA